MWKQWLVRIEHSQSNKKQIQLTNSEIATISFEIPKDAGGIEIHLILEVNDVNEIASLSDYRRIVITIN